MDRPPGPPGAPNQSNAGKGLPLNPAQNRRPVGSLSANPPAPPPLPPLPTNLRNVPSNPTLSVGAPMSAGQVIALAREAMRSARDENETKAAETSAVSTDLKPGLTIDMSRKNIQKLPDEVVDVIKNELERLALSHNSLKTFPARFSECTSLRYLNLRNNKIRDFPMPLCDLRSLEILDLDRNRLQVLPPEIVKLASLKVFALQKNRIEELPLCLADMVSLQVLKLEGNPIRFPPPEVLQVKAGSPPNEGFLKDNEVTEVAMTTRIKKFLRERAISDSKTESDTAGEESSEGNETPRLPMKRVMSGRFPIKVNGADVPDIRSPNMPRPPPIPTRSHYRGLSQQGAPTRKPGVMPLTIGNVNERLRSNSETLLQASRAERPESRQRRMGIVSKKANELGTLDETQANNRFSHYRGLSHGSAMQGNGNMLQSPASPAGGEPVLQRPIYVRRLSVLPERRRESKVYDPVVEAAKGILYSVFQIHPLIQMLMSLTSDGSSKRSSLEIVFYNTNSHVEELEQEIQRHDPSFDDGEYDVRENENVHRACLALVGAYTHVCALLAGNIDSFVDNGDPRYIRTLLVQLYNSIMEIRATLYGNGPQGPRGGSFAKPLPRSFMNNTIRPHSREKSITPTADRSGVIQRPRNGQLVHNPSNLRVATDVGLPYLNGSGSSRTATISSATPRSGESFASSSTSGGRGVSEFTDEDSQFERIFLSLQKSSELVMRTLPPFNQQLTNGLRNAMAQRAPEPVIRCWKALIAKCNTAILQTELLKTRMSQIKLKEPGIRTQSTFWNLCNNFIESWVAFVDKVREGVPLVALPADSRMRLKPIQQSMKETGDSIAQSTWSYCLRSSQSMASTTSPFGPQTAQLPVTPQSAALGPAVQATVPSTPQSASFNSAFSGNIYERADALMNMGGMSMSRAGTMTNSSGSSGYGSMSSMTSDGTMTPSSMLSPQGYGMMQGLGQPPIRINGKVQY